MLSDRDVKFFRPLWRRVAVIVFCLALSVWEWSNGNELWVGITLAITAYSVWVLFIDFDKDDDAGVT